MPLSACQLFHSPVDHPPWHIHMLDRFFISGFRCSFWRKKKVLFYCRNVSKSGAPWMSLKRQDKPVSLFSYYRLLSISFFLYVHCHLGQPNSPTPPIAFYYPLWWFLTFSRQKGHLSPQSVIKGISNCTQCYLLELGALYSIITCTFCCCFCIFDVLLFIFLTRAQLP